MININDTGSQSTANPIQYQSMYESYMDPQTEEVPLINNNVWYGVVELGTPPQEFKVLFDTGSSDFWVRSVECQSLSCQTNPNLATPIVTQPYDNRLSSTFKAETNTDGRYALHPIQYGTGYVDVILAQDYLRIKALQGTLGVPNQDFGMSYIESKYPFSSIDVDGIMGLGFPDLALNGTTPVLFHMKEAGVIPQAMFSYYTKQYPNQNSFADSVGEIQFGGYDSSLFSGDLQWMPVTDPKYWTVELDGIFYGDQNLLDGLQTTPVVKQTAILDTGTTGIVLPTSVSKYISKEIGGFQIPFIGMLITHCSKANTSLPLVFRFKSVGDGYHDFSLPASEYIVSNSLIWGWCLTSIVGKDIASSAAGGYLTIMGSAFLENYYSVWDVENRQVGIAPLN